MGFAQRVEKKDMFGTVLGILNRYAGAFGGETATQYMERQINDGKWDMAGNVRNPNYLRPTKTFYCRNEASAKKLASAFEALREEMEKLGASIPELKEENRHYRSVMVNERDGNAVRVDFGDAAEMLIAKTYLADNVKSKLTFLEIVEAGERYRDKMQQRTI